MTSSLKGYLSLPLDRSRLQRLRACAFFPIALSMPPSLDRDPQLLGLPALWFQATGPVIPASEQPGNIWPLECWRNGWDPGSDQWDTSPNNWTLPDLKDKPLKDPDLELFTDGSSFVQEGRRMGRDAVVTTDKIDITLLFHGLPLLLQMFMNRL
ncbi:hypothetical protein GRJ2_003234800 [Grus japonensis]|uniref:Uncharacterized protein n=1 Tax=Grus japonensis TaxID=30415 RepID=A0ABC9YDL8_GRUJA